MNKQKFLETIKTIDGRLSPKRLRKEYFCKRGLGDLWDWFESVTSPLSGYDLRSKVYLIERDIFEAPKCIRCEQNAKVQFYEKGGKISEYCSAACATKSEKRSQKMAQTKKEYSEEKKTLVNEKRKESMRSKYGYEYNSFGLHKNGKPHNWKSLPDEEIVDEYTSGYSLVSLGDKYGVNYDTIRTRLTKNSISIRQHSNRSREELAIEQYIRDLGFEVEVGNRSILSGKELDIAVHSKKLAIELDGLMWHSSYDVESDSKLKWYHLEKTEECQKLGYKLIHITDEQWREKQDIVKSMIANALGQTPKKVHARKCSVIEVDTKTAREFFDSNHIQGFVGSSTYLGLTYNEELVSCMAFSRIRFERLGGFEITRSATKRKTQVLGGFSKLLKEFLRDKNSTIILSYADRMYSDGNVYLQNGFKLVRTSAPGYYWCDKRRSYSRHKFQKHKLKDVLGEFNPELSERDNMFANGYRRFWDCGQLTFVLELNRRDDVES